jgi:hypothetical protein
MLAIGGAAFGPFWGRNKPFWRIRWIRLRLTQWWYGALRNCLVSRLELYLGYPPALNRPAKKETRKKKPSCEKITQEAF